MTTRQYILDILEDSPNREELILRLCDLVEGERHYYYEKGQKIGRVGAQWDQTVAKLHAHASEASGYIPHKVAA